MLGISSYQLMLTYTLMLIPLKAHVCMLLCYEILRMYDMGKRSDDLENAAGLYVHIYTVP